MNNLPVELSSFIGRAHELVELQGLLKGARLLTLTGIGGAGKSRLAIKLAETVAEDYPHGVWLVSLGPILEERLLPQAVASVLDVRERSGESLDQSLSRHLRERKALLLLDGCEHLVDACARLVELMLGAGRELTVLATSQEALRVPGEITWRVPSLSLPDAHLSPPQFPSSLAGEGQGGGASSLAVEGQGGGYLDSEAVRLFAERAHLVQPGFTVDDQTGPFVARICRRLDGLPLAIELAAAQLRLMTLRELEVRLQDRFRLLTGGSRTAMARHQTLRATVDWSYQHLGAAEQALFRRVAVFAGSFNLEAAEAVCAGRPVPADVLGCLGQLVDRSMVSVQHGRDGEARYQLLETLRQYGQERLQDVDEGEVRRKHAEYFAGVGAAAAAELLGPKQQPWFERLDREQDNFRAALTWSLQNEPAMALAMAASLAPYWHFRGAFTEGNEWLSATSAASPGLSSTLARALTHAGWIAYWQGDYERSRRLAESSLKLARELGDDPETARAVNLIGGIYHIADEDFEAARRSYAEALAIRERIGDRGGVASGMNNVALAAYDAGDYQEAQMLLQKALGEIDSLRDGRGRANSLDSLARVEFELGNLQRAGELYRECLVLAREIGDKVDTVEAIDGLARFAIAAGKPDRGLLLAGAASAIGDRIGYETPKPWRRRLEQSLAQARAAVTAELAATAWDRGLKLTEEDAVLLALQESSIAPARASDGRAPAGPLTAREREIAALIAAGHSNKQVAIRLKIAERTADAHVEHIRSKLDVHNRAAIAAWATRNGLLLQETSR